MADPVAATTLADVAREAGVSEITVSRVIRRRGPISDATRQRVEAAIGRVGYVPNRIAGSLASARSDLIGVIIPSLSNIVFPDVLRGLHDSLSGRDLRAVVGITDYRSETERQHVRSLLAFRPAALVITGCEHDEVTRAMLGRAGITVVEVMDVDGPQIDITVGMSPVRAACETARYLLGRGYRSFGYVGHDLERDLRARKRRDSFVATILAAGQRFVGEMLVPDASSVPAGRIALARLLAAHPGVDAVYFSNDDMAMGGVFHCLAEGIVMPDRLAIAGFNGLDLGQALPQPLTTVRTFRYEIGLRAGRSILARLDNSDVAGLTDVGFELIKGATA